MEIFFSKYGKNTQLLKKKEEQFYERINAILSISESVIAKAERSRTVKHNTMGGSILLGKYFFPIFSLYEILNNFKAILNFVDNSNFINLTNNEPRFLNVILKFIIVIEKF